MHKKYENPIHVCTKEQNIKSTAKINSAVVIPALNPIPNLVDFVEQLIQHGVPQVIVVNDGSDSSFNDIFDGLKQVGNCTVLTHEINRGKGRALKTAFSYFLEHYSYMDGVVTADADGQHIVEDICAICERLSLKHDSLILGVRDFSGSNVPKRSHMGNAVTSRLFQVLYGYYLSDTQTGLRGIPANELQWMLDMNGERYDYELNMLIKARRRNIHIETIPIKTVYFDNNSGSHYSTVKDSARVFVCLVSGLIQYSGSAGVASIFDVSVFFILNTIVLRGMLASERIFISTVIARIISSICNYILNRRFTFADTGKLSASIVRYYTLCICQMMTSYGLVYAFSLLWKVNESIIKLIVDMALGFISYQLQLHWVFRKKDGNSTFLTMEEDFPLMGDSTRRGK